MAKAKRGKRLVVAVLRDGIDVSAKRHRRSIVRELRTGTRKPPRRRTNPGLLRAAADELGITTPKEAKRPPPSGRHRVSVRGKRSA
jgi:hypothetical protein